MNSMLKLQLAYEEAKTALQERKTALETSKKPTTAPTNPAGRLIEQPFDKIAQISDLLSAYLSESNAKPEQ